MQPKETGIHVLLEAPVNFSLVPPFSKQIIKSFQLRERKHFV